MGEKETKSENGREILCNMYMCKYLNYEKEGIFLIIPGTSTYSFVICSIFKVEFEAAF